MARKAKPFPPALHPAHGLPLPTRFKTSPGAERGAPRQGAAEPTKTSQPVGITCIDYAPDNVQVEQVKDLPEFLGRHRPEWTVVRWINVDGLQDIGAIRALAGKYELHPLSIEDVLHIPQRPKVDSYGGEKGGLQARLLIITRMLELHEGRLDSEQISIFLGHKTVLTFQESPGDIWGPVRQRIQTKGTRLRLNDASFLVYSLLDAIIDNCFPILEHYGDHLQSLEERVLGQVDGTVIREAHRLKRELLLLRHLAWPMREVVQNLAREPHECLSETTRTYLRDVYAHTVQIIDILETYREVAIGITETYMSAISNRLNEVMKVLTMLSAIFIPVTFLASVFGMNFERFPWKWPHAFPVFSVVCLSILAGMLIWFRRRGWLN